MIQQGAKGFKMVQLYLNLFKLVHCLMWLKVVLIGPKGFKGVQDDVLCVLCGSKGFKVVQSGFT